MSQLWNTFNTLQILTALCLLIVKFPANVITTKEAFESIINFELVPKEFLYDNIAAPLFDLETSDEKLERQKSE